jgi:hypothetical protein
MNKIKLIWNKLSKTQKFVAGIIGSLITILTLIVLLDQVWHILKNVIEYIKLNSGSTIGGS